MASEYDTKAIRDTIAALDDLDVPASEIRRRLAADECDLGYAVDISQRAVYYHRTAHREAKARAELSKTTASESIEAAKKRAADLLARELLAHEKKPPGSMGVKGAAAVERIHLALVHMEKAERTRSRPAKDTGKQESAIEKLARAASISQESPGFVPPGPAVSG